MTDQTSDALTFAEQERYSRHLALPAFGEAGQRRLKRAKVLLVGLGGLGSPAAAYLAACGVGELGLVEFDTVSASNLHRQLLYGTEDLGRPKLQVAAARLRALNPHVRVTPHEGPLTPENAEALVAPYDLVVDGSDNAATRYALNDACHRLKRPWVHAALHRFEGQLAVFVPGRGPCYRCVFPAAAAGPDCSESGVLGVLPGILGTLQATEALKLLAGIGEPLVGRLLLVDALAMRFTPLEASRSPDCPLCGDRPVLAPPPPTAPDEDDEELDLSPRAYLDRLEAGAPLVLLDVRERRGRADPNAPGARRLPLSRLSAELATLPADACYVTLCDVGSVSLEAARLMRAAGFRQAWSVRGGFSRIRWEKARSGARAPLDSPQDG